MIKDLSLQIWNTLSQAAPYILFGTFIAGLITSFLSQRQIVKYLGKDNFKSVLWAALWGVPLPLCSCGVIPTAVSLRKNGASKGATLAFLISTPETGVDSITLSYALLDPIITIFRPFAAFVSAIVAGILQNVFGKDSKPALENENISAKPDCCAQVPKMQEKDFLNRFKTGMRYAFVDLLGTIAPWFMLGIFLAALISYFIPQTLIENYLGYSWKSMFLVLLIAVPLYICASASTPIAAALILKGMSPGAALVLLLAGPATNAVSLVVLTKFLGKKSVLIYLFSICFCAIVLGLLLNQIYLSSGINIKASVGGACHILPQSLNIAAALVLILLMINSQLAGKNT